MCRSNIDTLSLAKQRAEQFEGLPGRKGRFDIIKALKAVGQDFGFNKSLIAYLELVVSYTREDDWKGRDTLPIAWLSVQEIAKKLSLSTRQVNRIEKDLVSLQAIALQDYGNYRRFGKRDEEGSVQFAYGVDLRPLALLWEELTFKVEMQKQNDRLWKETRYAISGLRRQIGDIVRSGHAVIADMVEEVMSDCAMTARIGQRTSLDGLKAIAKALQEWLERLIKTLADNMAEKTPLQGKMSDGCDTHVRHHIIPTNIEEVVSELGENLCNNTQPTMSESDPPIKGRGSDSLAHNYKRQKENSLVRCGKGSPPPLPLIVQSSSPRMKALLEEERALDKPTIDQIVKACARLAPRLGVSVPLWREANGHLNSFGASLALIIIDSRHYAGQIHSPGGLLRGMLEKDRQGLLNLNPSLYAMVDRTVSTSSPLHRDATIKLSPTFHR